MDTTKALAFQKLNTNSVKQIFLNIWNSFATKENFAFEKITNLRD